MQSPYARGDFVEDLLEQALARARLSDVDRRLCQELVYGIVRWQATLDWLIARKTANRTQKPALQNLLQDDPYAFNVVLVSIVRVLSHRLRRTNEIVSSIGMLSEWLAGSLV